MADDAEVGDGNDYSKIIANPAVPQEIGQAAQSGELVVFVGAGISKLISCPSWDEFADRVLDQLVPKGIDHYELSQIKGLKDPKKRWATWLTDIIEINPQVIHVSGKDNPVADAMTRLSFILRSY